MGQQTGPVDGKSAPLLFALQRHATQGRSGWHTPGHKAGQAWPRWLSEDLARLDLTELPLTDDINQPQGPALLAMQLAARACAAGLTRFITSGTTVALQILLAWAVGSGGSLLLARTSHRSVVHAAALLDLKLTFFQPTGAPPPDQDSQALRLTLLAQATAVDIEEALLTNPGCQAVLVTSPDYYGGCAALGEIAAVVHKHGALLLVDEAHGAHLPYAAAGQLPSSALAAGADACVQSAHKTLPVLTGGSFLHVSQQALAEQRLDPADLARLIPVFQTSSPSLPVAASLDYARWLMEKEGQARIKAQLEHLADFKRQLPDFLLCQPAANERTLRGLGRDPLRLVITTKDRLAVTQIADLAAYLSDQAIDLEFMDLTRLVLIPSLWQSENDWQRLLQAIWGWARKVRLDQSATLGLLACEKAWRGFFQPQKAQLPLREAVLAKYAKKPVPLAQAAGLLAAELLAPYPPGLGLVWPGEIISREMVDFLEILAENKINISGVQSGKVYVFA